MAVNRSCPYDLPSTDVSTGLNPLIEKHEMALLMLLGFAGFSVMLGIAYKALRHYVFKDFHNLDLVFDAGGRVSLSLTAVTATSQLLWPADFLQSPTIASKVGIGGSLWYTMAIVLSVLAFPLLCIKLKTRAPGAKTFPQIAYARFGKPTHIMFCAVALFTNLVITANLILAGKAAIDVMAKDSSQEFILIILAVLFGSYCLIGGLGTTFYMSYFNTSLIFISTSLFILKIKFFPSPEIERFTKIETMYDALACLKGPDGNSGESYLTFQTESGLIYGVVTLFMTVAIVFCDQANWQSRIAAKPTQGMLGFIIAGFLWFAIPTSLSFVNSMTYMTMSFANGTNLLTDAEIDEGFLTPFVVQTLLGKEGVYLLLTLMTMTLMSTGSGEVMSISSILVYDIFKTYVKPFRKGLQPNQCVLCGKNKLKISATIKLDIDVCQCPTATDCTECKQDIEARLSGKQPFEIEHKCIIHGQDRKDTCVHKDPIRNTVNLVLKDHSKDEYYAVYKTGDSLIQEYRRYEDQLIRVKTWCMIWVVICLVPFGLLIIESGMNLNWAFLASQVFIAPFLVPLYFTIGWARASAKGLIAGSLMGLVASISGMLAYASRYEGGLSKFYVNTAQDWSILTGLLAGVFVSTVVSVIVSIVTRPRSPTPNTTKPKESDGSTHDIYNKAIGSESWELIEWQKTMAIDNPLNPYRNLYTKEIARNDIGTVLTSKHMESIFQTARRISWLSAAIGGVVFLGVIPVVALTQDVLSLAQLDIWISACQYWCLIGTFFVVLVPPIQEGVQIYRQFGKNRQTVEDREIEQTRF